jgi:carbamoyl-phosphate synthase large subunit
MQQTILIFGGGDNQLTLIEAARDIGIRSVVIDPNPEAPGRKICDHFEVVEAADYNLTKNIALKYKAGGIVTSQMENPLKMMARLAKEFEFVFPSPEVIERCRNKYLMKQAFLMNNIPCAKGILIVEKTHITPEIIKDFKFPLIIKPLDSYSSRGVYRVTSFKDLLHFESESRNNSSDGSVIIEEYIDGPEYSVEALTYRGKTKIVQFTEKIITPFPHTVEIGHLQPANLNEEQKAKIEEIVTNAITSLGIDNSASHTELKMRDNNPVIIEIGARLGGDYISSYLTLISTGVNMDKGAINLAFGLEPDIEQKSSHFSYIKYLDLPPGRVLSQVNEWIMIKDIPYVVHANLNVSVGQIIPPLTDSSKRPGFIIVSGNSRNEVIQRAIKAEAFLKNKLQFKN